MTKEGSLMKALAESRGSTGKLFEEAIKEASDNRKVYEESLSRTLIDDIADKIEKELLQKLGSGNVIKDSSKKNKDTIILEFTIKNISDCVIKVTLTSEGDDVGIVVDFEDASGQSSFSDYLSESVALDEIEDVIGDIVSRVSSSVD